MEFDFERLCEQIKQDEGFRAEAYLDTKGIPTIGFGQTRIHGRQVQLGDTTTREAAEAWLREHLRDTLDRVRGVLDFFDDLPEDARQAVGNMAYQLGVVGVCGDGGRRRGFQNMLAALRERDFERAADECLESKYAKVDTPSRAHRQADLIRGCA